MADEIRGVNHMTLAALIGECGDLAGYPKKGHVWKRVGLAVIGGVRQKRMTDPDAAAAHGFVPARRSTVWNIGEALFKAQGKDETAGPYRQVYDARKAYELAREDAGKPSSLGQAHKRAKRYMLKRFVKHVWQAWRAAETAAVPAVAVDDLMEAA
jgi:hypothetical protein